VPLTAPVQLRKDGRQIGHEPLSFLLRQGSNGSFNLFNRAHSKNEPQVSRKVNLRVAENGREEQPKKKAGTVFCRSGFSFERIWLQRKA
jgi:hypothetical protein